jgi:hypothetical protein
MAATRSERREVIGGGRTTTLTLLAWVWVAMHAHGGGDRLRFLMP